MKSPKIIQRTEQRLSPWTSVIAKTLIFPHTEKEETYHSLHQADYVNVLALTDDGRIPLVRQYRPTVEKYTLELPGGLREGDEEPLASALRELREETGLEVTAEPISLGSLAPDSGRLQNRFWGFVARTSHTAGTDWRPEPGVQPLLVTKKELQKLILDGDFDNALHVALIGMATIRGLFDWQNKP